MLLDPRAGMLVQAITGREAGVFVADAFDEIVEGLPGDLGIEPALGKAIFIIGRAPGRGRRRASGEEDFGVATNCTNTHEFVRLEMHRQRARARLVGPENPLLQSGHVHTLQSVNGQARRQLAVEPEIVRDPVAAVAKIESAGKVILLNEGECSDWVQVEFDTGIPGGRALGAVGATARRPAIVRFFLKQAHPKCELYASPINIDPSRPITKISEPEGVTPDTAWRDLGPPSELALVTRTVRTGPAIR